MEKIIKSTLLTEEKENQMLSHEKNFKKIDNVEPMLSIADRNRLDSSLWFHEEEEFDFEKKSLD